MLSEDSDYEAEEARVAALIWKGTMGAYRNDQIMVNAEGEPYFKKA